MLDIDSSERESIFAFAHRWQIAAGAWIQASGPIEPMRATWSALLEMPTCKLDSERLAAAIILDRVADRLMRHTWCTPLDRIDHVSMTLGYRHASIALTYLLQNYSSSTLSLQDLATHVGVSRCHLSRILRHESGFGFADHINGCRVLAAIPLLLRRVSRVKEAAAAVGYGSPGELDRQFNRRLRMSSAALIRLAGVCWSLDSSRECLSTGAKKSQRMLSNSP